MDGKEVRVFEQYIVVLLAEKWGHAYSKVCGYV
jgi:hypothetical protein